VQRECFTLHDNDGCADPVLKDLVEPLLVPFYSKHFHEVAFRILTKLRLADTCLVGQGGRGISSNMFSSTLPAYEREEGSMLVVKNACIR
jgi:hypothetical protein